MRARFLGEKTTFKVLMNRVEGEADKAGEDTGHGKDFLPGIGLTQENQAVGKADDGAAATDGGDNCYERIRVTQGEHIDVVRNYQKHRNQDDGSDVFYS